MTELDSCDNKIEEKMVQAQKKVITKFTTSWCSATFILSSLHLGLVQLCLEGLVMRHSGGCERFLITKQFHKKKIYLFIRDVPP